VQVLENTLNLGVEEVGEFLLLLLGEPDIDVPRALHELLHLEAVLLQVLQVEFLFVRKLWDHGVAPEL